MESWIDRSVSNLYTEMLDKDVKPATTSDLLDRNPLEGSVRYRRSYRPLRIAVLATFAMVLTAGVALGGSGSARDSAGNAVTWIASIISLDSDGPVDEDARVVAETLSQDGPESLAGLDPTSGKILAKHSRGELSTTLSGVAKGDELCLVTTTKFGGAPTPDGATLICPGPISTQRPIATAGARTEQFRVVGGVVEPTVESVEIFVDDDWQAVSLDGEAFVWIAPSPTSAMGALRATLEDGETRVVPIL